MRISYETVALVLFFLWGLPLSFFRSRFRKMVYRTDSWTINIKPYFWKELKVLFGVTPLVEDDERALRRRYGAYLVVYLTLLALVIWL